MLVIACTGAAQAQPGGCNAPAATPSVTISLPASPFMVVPSKDGCWLFVSLMGSGGNSGIAVLKRSGGNVEFVRMVPVHPEPTGIALTHDGKLLIAAATNKAVFVDVPKMIAGARDAVVGAIPGGRGSIYANTTADDRLLFVSEENGSAITVIDLERARRDGYKPEDVIGKIPAGLAPIALTFSPDGKWLYTTSELAMPDWNWPKACKPEGRPVPDSVITRPEGAVIVVDVERAKTDPAHAAVARVPAGCSPVRMSISPQGDRIYVTARNSNAVLEFDTAKLVTDGAHALVGIAPAGDAPVPVMVVDHGKRIVAGNSNRFGSLGAPSNLVVLDAARMHEGLAAVQGLIPSGSFPREMALSSDGRTLFLTNFASNSLQVMDVAHLPIDSKLPPDIAKNAEALAHRHDYKPVVVKPVVVDLQLLKRYAGVYRASPTQTVVIGMDGNEMTARLTSFPPASVVPESDTKFFAMGMEIEFPKLAEGELAAQQLTLRMGPRETAFHRLDDEAAKPILEASAALVKRIKENKPNPASEAVVRKLIAGLQAGKPDAAMFARGAEQFLQQLQSQISQMGTVKSVTFQAVGSGGSDIYRVESNKGSWMFWIWLADDGKVERALVQPAQ